MSIHIEIIGLETLITDLLSAVCNADLDAMVSASPATSVADSAALIARNPRLVLIGVSSASCASLSLIDAILGSLCSSRIIAFCDGKHSGVVKALKRRGLPGIVDAKRESLAGLKDAIHAILNGVTWTSSTIDSTWQWLKSSPDSYFFHLSAREETVLRLAAEGLSNLEIEETLTCSPHTVQVHRKHIMQKLGIHSSTKLVHYAMAHGFLQVDHILYT